MAKDHSFDIVSQVNFQEVTNAVEQAKKEILTRYDFKGSSTSMAWDPKKHEMMITTETDFRMKAVIDILMTRLVKRGVSIKAIEYGPLEKAQGGSVRQVLSIRSGIPTEKSREIVKFIKASRLKVQPQIQELEVRVQGAKIDELQGAIKLLKTKDFGLDLQFTNYR